MTQEQASGRVIDVSVDVEGTPEEVWRAIATGPGISSWFVPHEVAEYEGGQVLLDFGTFGQHTATVAAWEPPHRVVFTGGTERPLAYEWLVEAKDGGTCSVRLVNSGFGPEAEWDAEYDGMSEGWRIFLANLRLHCQHFRGRTARAIVPVGVTAGSNAAAFTALCAALGVPDDLEPGQQLRTTGADVPSLSGTVVEARRFPRASAYLLLLDSPVPGTAFVAAEGDGDFVGLSTYLYLYEVGDQRVEDKWTPWFAERFPLPQGEPAGA